MDSVYKKLKGGGEFNFEDAEFNKVLEVVLAYPETSLAWRQARVQDQAA